MRRYVSFFLLWHTNHRVSDWIAQYGGRLSFVLFASLSFALWTMSPTSVHGESSNLCGPQCLFFAAHMTGRPITMDQIVHMGNKQKNERWSFDELQSLIEVLGGKAVAIECNLDHLFQLQCPAILALSGEPLGGSSENPEGVDVNHFVLYLGKVPDEGVYVYDPGSGMFDRILGKNSLGPDQEVKQIINSYFKGHALVLAFPPMKLPNELWGHEEREGPGTSKGSEDLKDPLVGLESSSKDPIVLASESGKELFRKSLSIRCTRITLDSVPDVLLNEVELTQHIENRLQESLPAEEEVVWKNLLRIHFSRVKALSDITGAFNEGKTDFLDDQYSKTLERWILFSDEPSLFLPAAAICVVCHGCLGQDREAIDLARRVLDSAKGEDSLPSIELVLDTTSICAGRLKDYRSAIWAYRKVIEKLPFSLRAPQAAYALRQLYQQFPDEARN